MSLKISFVVLELIQFVLGISIITGNYFLIAKYRKPLLDYTFKTEADAQKSFIAMTNIIYFLIFIPAVFFGIDLEQPVNYKIAKHIQHIIYYEAALVALIGVLHFFLTAISSKLKL